MAEQPDFAPSDYYEILQVSPNAEDEIIEAAYRRLAMKYHPDHSRLPDAGLRMRLLNQAYAVLRDPVRRALYDRARAGRFGQRLTSSAQDRGTRRPPLILVRTTRIVLRALAEEPIVGGGFTLDNAGEGLLHGTLSAKPAWLRITPDRFSGTPISVLCRVDTRELANPSNHARWHEGQIYVRTNGGEARVPVLVLAPARPHFPGVSATPTRLRPAGGSRTPRTWGILLGGTLLLSAALQGLHSQPLTHPAVAGALITSAALAFVFAFALIRCQGSLGRAMEVVRHWLTIAGHRLARLGRRVALRGRRV